MSESPGKNAAGNYQESDSVVPFTLLSLAKDARYMKSSEDLLCNILESFFPGHHNSEEEHRGWASIITTLLYGVLVTGRLKRTAGMEACGLEFETISRRRLTLGILGSSFFQYLVRFHFEKKTPATLTADETLTGSNRRQIFERQRDDLRRRIQTISEDASDFPAGASSNVGQVTEKESWIKPIVQMCKRVLSLPPGCPGPHAVASSVPRDSEWDSLLVWVIRLHLALYCWRGDFPTLVHRFIYRSRLRSSSNATPSASPVRTVGLILGFYSGGNILQILARRVVKLLVERAVDDHAEQTTERAQNELASDARGRPIPIHSLCAICGAKRHKPACSIHCGHVFCWGCLQRWIASTSEACPMCRKPCKARDVVLLRNYDGYAARSN